MIMYLGGINMRKFIMSVAAVLLMASSLSTMAKAAEEVSIPFGAFSPGPRHGARFPTMADS